MSKRIEIIDDLLAQCDIAYKKGPQRGDRYGYGFKLVCELMSWLMDRKRYWLAKEAKERKNPEIKVRIDPDSLKVRSGKDIETTLPVKYI